MAVLTQEQRNLIETALDAPMSKSDLAAMDMMALMIVEDQTGEAELDNLKKLKFRILLAQQVNKVKQNNGR